MQNKTKNIIIIIEFFAILICIMLLNFIKEDKKISVTERRSLMQFPKITMETIFDGKLSKDFESYAVDQFIERDFFRSIKYFYNSNILRQLDNNKLFIKDSAIYKMEYPLRAGAIEKSAEKINKIYEKYMNGNKVYFSIIPDKNYYLKDEHLKIDYEKLEKIMKEKLSSLTYIDIKDLLQIEDFYRTDLHWKQTNIEKVADRLKLEMNLEKKDSYYKKQIIGDFYGGYYGQAGKNIEPDNLEILTNSTIDNCVTYNYETESYSNVYDMEKYKSSSDKYDIYLSGATPLIEIENSNATTNKELILFRDSYGSSIAPFFIENYKKIMLVDIRYISSSILENFINFDNKDVLFLYSGTVLNQNIFK